MSFYATSPVPTSDPAAPSNQPAGWPAALDQLILQQAPSSQMGALRRPGSTIADALPSELPNYGPPVDNDRLLLEAFGNQEIQRAAMRQPAPNQLDPTPQQTNVNNYRQAWERPSVGINGCNVPNLLPEAYQVPNDLSLDPSAADDFASRNRHPQTMGLGPYVMELMKFHEEQQRPAANGTLESFWKPLFAKYFAPDATLHMEIRSENSQEQRIVKLPVEALPRIWMSKFDAGVQEERLLMENPCEYLYTNGFVVVDCRGTVILTKYEQSTVVTDGHLRVQFCNNKKIMLWHFSPRSHQELFPGSLLGLGVPPASAICRYGMPLSIVRLMYIAEDIRKMGPRIDAEISKLQSSSVKPQQLQSQVQQQEHKQAAGYAGLSKGESNGNAYRAILSQLDGVQGMPLDQALGDAPVVNAASSSGVPATPAVQGLAGTVVQGLHNNLSVDLKQSLVNGDPNHSNIRDPMASWRSDQSGDVFPSLFEDSMRASFSQRENELAARGTVQSQEDLEAKKQIASGLSAPPGPQAGHSVADDVVAAASGHRGWGVGSTEDRNYASSGPQAEDLNQSLQLLSNVPTDGTLNLQSGGETPGTNDVQQSAPPGLSIFTPKSEQLEKNGKSQTARRKSQNHNLRDVGPSASLPPGNGNHKNYNGVRTYQRPSVGRLKRGNQTSSAPNVSGQAVDNNIMGVSRGISAQNGGVPTKGSSPGGATKPVKDRGQGVTGTRRSSGRSTGADGREKRQKTGQAGSQT